jgi:hypothetical protein
VDSGSKLIRRFDPELNLSLAAVDIPNPSLSSIAVKDGGLEMLGSSAGMINTAAIESSVLTASKPITAVAAAAAIAAPSAIAATARIDRSIVGAAASATPKKVAVLICGDVAESGYDEFWNDV